MIYPKKIITRIAVIVVVLVVAASLTVFGLHIYKQTQTTTPQPVVTLTEPQRLRQKGIDEITSGNTSTGINDLTSAIKLLDAKKDASAISEIKQQIDYAQLEPAASTDTAPHTIDASKDPNAIKR